LEDVPVKLCKNCVNPDTRPNIFFDAEGLCPVCQNERDKVKVDWAARRAEIREIADWGRRNCRGGYDCMVTVSGGKDSMRQAFFARDELGLNPLLVSSVYPPEQLSERGANNLSNLAAHGFDTLTVGLNPQAWKRVMKRCFAQYSNLCKHTDMALYAIPIHVAIAYQIPLVFLGENPVHTIGEKHGRTDGDASQMKKSNTVGGGDVSGMRTNDISPHDLHFYQYPPDEHMQRANLRIHYLGYYIEDWSGFRNGQHALQKGLQRRSDGPEKTGDLWGFTGVDDDFRLVNQLVKYLKLGFGHVNDQCIERIIAGKMTREEAVELVKRYDGKCDDSYIQALCRFLDISEKEFWDTMERLRNPDIWKRNAAGEWELMCDYG
jgi:N-acetyl sugar amidotransferase